jgi:N-carbamoyl-L-amino-acid hydrolase
MPISPEPSKEVASGSLKGVRVNGRRLWQTLVDIAKICAIEGGGSNRLALTEGDGHARDLFVRWCRDAGCSIRIDAMGNVFARRPGRKNDLPPVISGSHLDTQKTGGIFDGIYGVLAALEVIRSLNDAHVETLHPIEAVIWTNEEGVRFAPAMMGSGVWSGALTLGAVHRSVDADGVSVAEALKQIGYLGEAICAPFPVHAVFEAHIEQGPILEQSGKTIGIVTAVQGVRWLDIALEGRSAHAGTTPMDMRRDPVIAFAQIIQALDELTKAHAPSVRLTVGKVLAEPGAYNTVAQRVTFGIDLRHPSQAALDDLTIAVRAIIESCSAARGMKSTICMPLDHAPVLFDETLVATIGDVAAQLGYSAMPILSGAAHDTMYVAKHAPAGMIFIPCEGGVSHHPSEKATPADAEAGCNVLLHAMARTAGLTGLA